MAPKSDYPEPLSPTTGLPVSLETSSSGMSVNGLSVAGFFEEHAPPYSLSGLLILAYFSLGVRNASSKSMIDHLMALFPAIRNQITHAKFLNCLEHEKHLFQQNTNYPNMFSLVIENVIPSMSELRHIGGKDHFSLRFAPSLYPLLNSNFFQISKCSVPQIHHLILRQ